MPLLKMPHPHNDGGYAVEDFKTVDPEIGTNDDLKKLTKELRKRGISLCLDVVMNHTADTHEWAMRAKAGEKEYMDRYMCYENYDIPARFESTMPQVFPTTAPGNFTWCEEMKRHVLTTFYPYQWDLNYRNPVVFREMVGNILYLANMGVEVFRIDAVPYIWKELDTNCRNLPQVHTIVRMIRIITEIVCPGVILKGEVVMAPHELPAYFGSEEQPECHMLYGVSSMVNLWSALASRDTRLLKHQLDLIHSLPNNCYFVNYLRCHDDIGWGLDEDEERRLQIDPLLHKEYLYHFMEGQFPGSFARGELYNYDPVTRDARSCGTTASLCGIEKGGFEHDELQVQTGIQRVLLMHAACMSLEGFMMLSSGDEIGQVNDYSYKENPDTAADSRYLHRSKFNWENADRRHEQGTVQQRVWDGLQNIESKRREHVCFENDTYVTTWDTENNGVFAIRRTNDKGELLCIANFTERVEVARLRALEGTYSDIFTGEKTSASYIVLAPYQYRWCEKIIN
jgi:amylosucrase